MEQAARSKRDWRNSVLGTRLGRRLLALFLGCALLPLVGFGWLALTQVSTSLHAELERNLHQSAKSAGMELARRLLSGADELEIAADLVRGGSHIADASPAVQQHIRESFPSVQVVDGSEVKVEVGTPRPVAPLTEAERSHLATGRTAARVLTHAKNPRVLLLRLVRPRDAASPVLVAELNRERLFDLEALRGTGAEVLVLSGNEEVLSHSLQRCPDLSLFKSELGVHPAASTFEWQVDGEPHLARYWRVFLRPQLGMDWFVLQSRSRTAVEAPIITFQNTFLSAAILTFFLVVASSTLQLRRTIVPIRQLLAATQRVASGDRDARAAVEGDDEFAQLGRSFDTMTEQLVENIRRRELGELDLIAARDAALAAVRAKADFLTNVSHELRTPLTSIVGAAEILRDYHGDDVAIRQEFSEIVFNQAMQLQSLIESVLALHDEDPAAFAPTDIEATLRDAVADLPEATRARVNVQVDDDLPAVAGSAPRLAYAWRHLLDNAAKFSEPQTPIEVHAHRRGDVIVVDVTDRGVGIAEADQDRIFQPFTQLGHDMLTAKTSGIGLGLTLVRSIVGGHGGRVTVASELGKGTTFRVALPVLPATPPAQHEPSAALINGN